MAKSKPWLLLPMLLTVSACSTGGVASDPCSGFRPILTSMDDRLTRETETAILAHNETGLALKCWSAP